MRRIATRSILAVALVGLLAGFALAVQPASALTIFLSDESSEPITNPAGDLVADLTFTVSGCTATDCTLTLRVDNRTDENPAPTYDINEIGFNASQVCAAARGPLNSTDATFGRVGVPPCGV